METLKIECFVHFYTGCNSIFRKIFEFKIWKEPMLVLKQTIPQKKALILSFLETETLRLWHYQESATPTCHKKHRWAWCKKSFSTASRRGALLIMPRPQTFQLQKSWVSELSSEVLFVSVLAMVLSENRKRLEENFRNTVISAISHTDKNYKNIFPPAFFNILKEPLLVLKQTIPQKKALILSLLQLEHLRAWHYQKGSRPTCRQKTLKKK